MDGTRRRWLILLVGVNAHVTSAAGLFGLPAILPAIRQELGVSLAAAGLLVGAPSIGAVATLVLWGLVADRRGERLVIGVGMTSCAVMLAVASVSSGVIVLFVSLVLASAAGAASLVGGGRIVLRWFPARERGIAMGVRQVSHTLGLGIAAFALPPIAEAAGFAGALRVSAAACLVAAGLAVLVVREPPRPPADRAAATRAAPRPGSPYRRGELWRVQGATALLAVPQFTVATYAVSWLVDEHGWDPIRAGWLFGVTAVMGAAARVGAGYWSDRTGRRMAPWRMIVIGTTGVMAVLALGERVAPGVGVAVLAVAAVITVSGNGLAYLYAGELAGPDWAGRVLGVHNTVQNVMNFLVTPLFGFVIGTFGYPAGFLAGACFALAAVPMIPIVAERRGAPGGRTP